MLPKHTHLWECKVNEETSLYEHSNENIEFKTLNTNDEIRNHLFSFHDVGVECSGTLYWTPIG